MLNIDRHDWSTPTDRFTVVSRFNGHYKKGESRILDQSTAVRRPKTGPGLARLICNIPAYIIICYVFSADQSALGVVTFKRGWSIVQKVHSFLPITRWELCIAGNKNFAWKQKKTFTIWETDNFSICNIQQPGIYFGHIFGFLDIWQFEKKLPLLTCKFVRYIIMVIGL